LIENIGGLWILKVRKSTPGFPPITPFISLFFRWGKDSGEAVAGLGLWGDWGAVWRT